MKGLGLSVLLTFAVSATAQTIRPDQVRGTAIVQNPVGGQSTANLNGVLNAAMFPGSDLGSKVQAVIAQFNGACGTILIPQGTYTWSTDSVLMKPCQTLIGDGAIVNVTVSNGKPFLIAAALPDFSSTLPPPLTNTQTYTQGGLRDITFVGPGAGTVGSPNSSTGIWIGGDSTGTLTPNTYMAFLMNMYNVHVRNFGCGVKYGIAFQIAWMGGSLEENYDNICFQDNTAGLENLNFHGTQILNAIHMGINQPYTDKFVEINLYGCSLDYDGQNDPNGALISTAFASVNIFGGHFESSRLPFFRFGSGSATVHSYIAGAAFNMVASGTFPAYFRVDGTNDFIMLGAGNGFGGSGTTFVTNLFDWHAAGSNNQAYIEPYLYSIGPNTHELPTFGGGTPQYFRYPGFDAAGDVISTETSASLNANAIGLISTIRASGTSVPSTQGGYLGWNRNVDGATDFVNNPGSAGGGWNWWSSNPAGSSVTKVASMDGTGSFTPRVLTPVPASTAPGGACTVAGTLQITADGHGTYCKVGTLVWTTLY